MSKIKLVALALVAVIALTPVLSQASFNQTQATAYLKSRPVDEWSVMALAAAGALDGVNLDFLKTPIATGRTTDYEKRILAIAAAGQNPASFGQENFVAKLKEGFDGTQIGDPQLLNDDIFGILALAAAGEGNGSIAAAGKTFLLQNQNPDGGWGYAPNIEPDSNDTAMAVSALLAAGVSSSDQAVSRALNYLAALKRDDGGYSYDNSGFGSDSASTSWVAAALRKAGRTVPAASAAYLEGLQLTDGSFKWQVTDSSGSPIMTAYALITLAGGTYPVGGSSAAGAAAQNSFQVCIKGQNTVLWNEPVTLPQVPPKAIDTVTEAAKSGGFTYSIVTTSFGPYVQTIDSDTASGAKGWLYQVGGVAPDVGAADYALKANDTVLWYYGQFGDPAPICPAAGGSGPGSQSVGLSATIEMPPATPAISFTVTPGNLNFGTLRPGQTNSQNLTLSNTGAASISITAQVQDSGTLFRDNLKLDSAAWQAWRASVTAGQNRVTAAALAVPVNVTSAGTRNATLIFWATP